MAIYTKTTWQNNVTPVNESNMNHIEEGIYNCSLTAVTNMTVSMSGKTITFKGFNAGDSEVFSKNLELNYISSIAFDGTTYVISYTTADSQSHTIGQFYDKARIDSAFPREIIVDEG